MAAESKKKNPPREPLCVLEGWPPLKLNVLATPWCQSDAAARGANEPGGSCGTVCNGRIGARFPRSLEILKENASGLLGSGGPI